MEAAITARLERVVQEVVEVRQRAQTLSEELESVRAERGVLLATLEEERAALAAARTALEEERAKLHERSTSLRQEHVPIIIDEEPLPVAEPEPAWEPVTVTESPTSRLPSPRKLLGKFKLVGRNKGKVEEPVVLAPITEPLAVEVIEAPVEPEIPPTIEFVPIALLEEEPQPAPEPEVIPAAPISVEAEVEKPKRAARLRADKPKKIAPLPRFAPREFLASLPSLDDDQLDLAAFGIAQLDDDGAIVALNHQGSALLATSKNEALDQTLFTIVLPDTDVATRFTDGIATGKLDTVLPVEGGFTVHLFRHGKSRTNWALLRKQEGGEA